MGFSKTSYGYLVRLEKGERFIETLKKFINDKGIKSGVFWAIGAMESVDLSFYDLKDKKYIKYAVGNPVEAVSCTGNIAWLSDELVVHCHGVFSDSDGKTVGGHLNEGIVGPTLELALFEDAGKIERKFDSEIGLNLLDI